ncbi:MAG: DUF642 domain-containing protein [Hyphomicrobiales bacterium]|nr:DUF642 domain-containing protein [Hyphomicrobiales bacterium]
MSKGRRIDELHGSRPCNAGRVLSAHDQPRKCQFDHQRQLRDAGARLGHRLQELRQQLCGQCGNFDANWKITENSVDIVNGSVPGNGAAYQGNQFLDLVGYGDKGTIEQTFATAIGQKYAFSFAYANNPINIGGNPFAAATVHLLGNGVLLSDTVSHGDSSAATMNWLLYSIVFEADAIETTVRFQNTVGGSNGGILLDAVSVEAASAVPVPAALPLFASGLGLLGFVGWRKRRKVAS